MEFIKNLLFQFICIAVVSTFIGYLLYIIRDYFCKYCGIVGNWFYKITGFIGGTLHELSHVIFCVLFFHKIKRVCLFNLHGKKGNYGYVYHTYNKKNPYNLLGSFFIGLSPLIVGFFVIFIISNVLFDNCIVNYINEYPLNGCGFFSSVKNLIIYFLNYKDFKNVYTWLILIISVSVMNHIGLGFNDIKSVLKGLLSFTVLLIITDIVLFFFFKNIFIGFTEILFAVSSLVVSFTAVYFMIIIILFTVLSFGENLTLYFINHYSRRTHHR